MTLDAQGDAAGSEAGTAGATILAGELAARGPNVIGATGGSGTRVVARICREAGMYTGERLNAYEDALDFGAFSDRWINGFLTAGRDLDAPIVSEIRAELSDLVERHLEAMPDTAPRWGWKEPRSIYLLPVFRAAMPSLRFLHFVRDGRDMALSDNQKQLEKHSVAVLAGERLGWRRAVKSIALWNRVNTWAADYGERELGSSYLRVRFEDLCAQPHETIAEILEFFGLEGDAEAAGRLVQPPATLGRWRTKSGRLRARLEDVGGDGLRRFGYL